MENTTTQSDTLSRRYDLHTPLGKGGMGIVYRATDRLTGQEVALKQVLLQVALLDPASQGTLTDDEKAVLEALAREFQFLASLQHPHIVRVLDYGFGSQYQPYIVQEFIKDARTLTEAAVSLSIYRKAFLLIQLLQALAYLHRRQVIHRDLKPANVLVTNDGQVKVVDFGLAIQWNEAKDAEPGGTLYYIAPEVLHDKPVTPAADLYAVGVMAFEIFTGIHPYDSTTGHNLIDNILHSEPDFDFLSSQISSSIETERRGDTINLAQDRQDITTSIRQMQDDLTTVLSGDLPHVVASDDNQKTVPLRSLADEQLDAFRASQQLEQKLEKAFADPDQIPELANIIRKLLAKDPSKRYEDANEVIRDITQALGLPELPESEAIRDSFLQAANFVGRTDELQKLQLILTDMLQGRGSGWLIGGESGVGKSRLIEEFVTSALIEGVTVLRGQGRKSGGEFYQIWREPLRLLSLSVSMDAADVSVLLSVVPDINDLLGTDYRIASRLEAKQARERLNQTIARVFRKIKQPTLLLLEDLHWAEAELEPLNLIIEQLQLPLLIIGSYRNNESPELPQKLPQMGVLALQRLNNTEINQLSMSILGAKGRNQELLAFLERETEGNTFFLVETLRVLAEQSGHLEHILDMELPQRVTATGIQAVIDEHLRHIPQAARRILDLAAIAGRYLDIAVLNKVSGTLSLEKWLTFCTNMAVIERQQDNWRFSHDKLRERLIEVLPSAQSQHYHLEIANAIVATYPNTASKADALTYHYGAAGDEVKELEYALLAAEQRYQTADFPAARTYFERILQIAPAPDATIHIQAHKRLGDAYHGLGDYQTAIAHFEAGLAKSEAASMPAIRPAIMISAGRSHMMLYQYDKAQQYFSEAMQLAEQHADKENFALALFQQGGNAFHQDDLETAAACYNQCLPLARANNQQHLVAMCLGNLGAISIENGKHDEAQSFYEEAMKIGRELGDRREMLIYARHLGLIAEHRGNLNAAQAHYEEALTLAKEIQSKFFTGWCLLSIGQLQYKQGLYPDALENLAKSRGILTSIDRRGLIHALTYLAYTYLEMKQYFNAGSIFIEAYEVAIVIKSAGDKANPLLGIAQCKLHLQDTINGAQVLGYLIAHHGAETQFEHFNALVLHDQYGSLLSNEDLELALSRGSVLSEEGLVELLTGDFE